MRARRTVLAMLVVLGAAVWLAATPVAHAAELLMFEERGCPWCERWRREIGVAYPNTSEGRRAPLRVVEIGQAQRTGGVALSAPVTVSPTFVLVDRGKELGRIVGYPGAEFFWGLLGQLLEKLDRSSGHPSRRAGSGRHGQACEAGPRAPAAFCPRT